MRVLQQLLQRLRGTSGQTTIEFALVVPLLCVLVLAFVDFGRAVLCWLDATHLANMGARAAAVSNWPGGMTLQDWIRSKAIGSDMRGDESSSSVPSPARVCISFPADKSVEVTVSVDYHLIPFVGVRVPLAGSSTMRIEQPPTYSPVDNSAGCPS